MVKRISLLLLSVFSVLHTVGQDINQRGEKMVKKLEIYNYDTHNDLFAVSEIVYGYGKDRKMNSVSKHTVENAGCDIRKRKDNLISTVTYKLVNGNLTKITKGSDGSGGKKHTFFVDDKYNVLSQKEWLIYVESYIRYDYGYDENNKLCEISYRFYDKNEKNGEYHPRHNEYVYYIDWINGCGYIDDYESEFSDYINDTNICFEIFFYIGDARMLFDDRGFIYSSEWFGMKSNRLMSEVITDDRTDNVYKMEYFYEKNGNINEIKMYHVEGNKEKKIRKIIKIWY